MKKNQELKREFSHFEINHIVGILKINGLKFGIYIIVEKNLEKVLEFFPFLIGLSLIYGNIFIGKNSIVPLYFAAERAVVERGKMLILVDDNRFKLQANEKIQIKTIRFRTLGCYPLTGAIESNASDLASIVLETLDSKTSERQGRLIDSDTSASMEKRRKRVTLMINEETSIKKVNTYIDKQANLDTLRFITCGSETMAKAH